MCKFAQISCNLQDSCRTTEQLQATFSKSCYICSTKGVYLKCDKCPIKAHFELLSSIIEEVKEKITA